MWIVKNRLKHFHLLPYGIIDLLIKARPEDFTFRYHSGYNHSDSELRELNQDKGLLHVCQVENSRLLIFQSQFFPDFSPKKGQNFPDISKIPNIFLMFFYQEDFQYSLKRLFERPDW